METLKKFNSKNTLSAIFVIILGLLFCLQPIAATGATVMFFGVLLSVLGVCEIVEYFRNGRQLLSSLVSGILEIVLGIFMCTNLLVSMVTCGMIFSLFIILTGITNMQRSFVLKQYNVKFWWVGLILSIMLLFIGISFIFTPVSAMVTVSIWNGILLIYSGIMNLVIVHFVSKVIQENNKEV